MAKAKSGLGNKGRPADQTLDIDELEEGNKHLESRHRARAKDSDARAREEEPGGEGAA